MTNQYICQVKYGDFYKMSEINHVLSRMMEAFGVSKYKELAEKLGVSPNTVDVWKKRNKIPEKNILKCVNLTGYPLKWITDGGDLIKEPSVQYGKQSGENIDIPMLKIDAGAGDGIYNYEPQKAIVSLSPIHFPFVASGKSSVIEIVGNSMEPELLHGDYIIVSPLDGERATEDGIYAIRIDGMVKVKALQFMLDGTIQIISYNNAYKTEVYNPAESQIDFEILGKKELRITR